MRVHDAFSYQCKTDDHEHCEKRWTGTVTPPEVKFKPRVYDMICRCKCHVLGIEAVRTKEPDADS